MIGKIQRMRQGDPDIHGNIQFVGRGVFDIDHLVDNLISGLNLIIQSIDLFGKGVKILLQTVVFVLA